MKRAAILTLSTVCPLVSACSGLNAVGVRLDPLPTEVAAQCLHPSEIPVGNDWEVFVGRVGDELIACRAQKDLAVTAYNQARDALSGD